MLVYAHISARVLLQVMRWSPPLIGKLKLNFDGYSRGNPRLAGYGCIIRDNFNNVVLVVSGPMYLCDSTKVELLGLSIGLQDLKSLGQFRVLGGKGFTSDNQLGYWIQYWIMGFSTLCLGS